VLATYLALVWTEQQALTPIDRTTEDGTQEQLVVWKCQSIDAESVAPVNELGNAIGAKSPHIPA